MDRINWLLSGLKWFLALVGVAAVYKACELRRTRVDGSGIGLQFLGIQITDRLPNAQIPAAADAFDLTATAALLTALGLELVTIWRRRAA